MDKPSSSRNKLILIFPVILLFLGLMFYLVYLPIPESINHSRWVSLGPYVDEIENIAVSPDFENDQAVFAVDKEGIYRSSDKGSSWTKLNADFKTNLRETSLVLSPTFSKDRTIYALGHNNLNRPREQYEVYKTTNAGNNWALLKFRNIYNINSSTSDINNPDFCHDIMPPRSTTSRGPPGFKLCATADFENITKITFSNNFKTDKTIFAEGSSKLFISSDDGKSWVYSEVNNLNSFAVSPQFAKDKTIIAGAADGLYKSTNGSKTWQKISKDFSEYMGFESVEISPNYAKDRTLFIKTFHRLTAKYGHYRSTDGGRTWVESEPSDNDSSNNKFPSHSTKSKTFFTLKDQSIFKTIDGGSEWTKINITGRNPILKGLVFSPGFRSDKTMFAFSDIKGRGIFRSTNSGSDWEIIYGTQVESIVKNMSRTSADRNRIFMSNLEADINTVALSNRYRTDKTIFIGLSSVLNSNPQTLFVSSNDGSDWSGLEAGFSMDPVNAIALSPNYMSDQTIIAANDEGLFKTTNDGISWSLTSNNILDTNFRSVIISSNYKEDGIIFATSMGKLYRSKDRGYSWSILDLFSDISAVSDGFQSTDDHNDDQNMIKRRLSRKIYSIAPSPDFAKNQSIYVGTNFGLFVSTDGGDTWVSPTSFKNRTISSVALSPEYNSDKTAYVITDKGISKTTDAGNKWKMLEAQPPLSSSRSIFISPGYQEDMTIYLSTYNNGIMYYEDK